MCTSACIFIWYAGALAHLRLGMCTQRKLASYAFALACPLYVRLLHGDRCKRDRLFVCGALVPPCEWMRSRACTLHIRAGWPTDTSVHACVGAPLHLCTFTPQPALHAGRLSQLHLCTCARLSADKFCMLACLPIYIFILVQVGLLVTFTCRRMCTCTSLHLGMFVC